MKTARLVGSGALLLIWLVGLAVSPVTARTESQAPVAPQAASLPRIHVRSLTGQAFMPAIFWFGQVDETSNYADVRLYHYDVYLTVVVTIIDRQVWYDTTPSAAEIPSWDAISLYLDLNGNSSASPSQDAYLFRAGIGSQAGYEWNGSAWAASPVSFIAEAGGRGYPNSDLDDKGWQVEFKIPFTSLGLSGPPVEAADWGLAVAMHDRDNAAGTALQTTVWPQGANPLSPASWGQLSLGNETHTITPALPSGGALIRQGLNGAVVPDGHVGGRTNCGDNLDHWSGWGNKNYAGDWLLNIQNQWDVSDYPCFSKYYVTFPLPALPAGKVLISAALSLTLFGTSGGGAYGTPPDSYIQVFKVGETWDESTLTWNNAPPVQENIAGTWVYPRNYALPYETYQWDVRRAVEQSLQAGTPLRLAVYSADGEMHSGKYFYSSNSDDWGGETRPTLSLVWGDACDAPGVVCRFTFLPLVGR